MKKSKKFLCLLLALVMAGSLLLLPAAAANTQSGATRYPTVYVHGLMGWGEHDQIYSAVPYWGLSTDLMPYMTSKGYESYAASVGPLSSAWDRACELYAQLTGTTVDYGAAHAAEYGHARYGATYDKPLFAGWSASKKINLVGHSFGGATIRLFLDILADGSAAEQAAAKAAGTEVSPFFEGGKADWVYSLTTLAAPHNGTTFLECCDNMAQFAAEASTAMAKLLGISDFKGVYDFQLEQFGFYRKDGETVLEALDRVLHSDFLSHNDNVFRDLTIDRALELNDDIEIQPNVYYFSYAGDKTRQNSATGERTSAVDMTPLFVPFANRMCSYYDQTTAGGFRIDKTWAPNDGLVNTVSALYPTDSAGRCLTKSGQTGYIQQDGYSNVSYQPGVWNVMPVRHYDHGNFIAGMPVPDLASQSVTALRQFYLSLMGNLSHVSAASGLPFTDVAADHWSYTYIKQMYDAGVVSGMTPTTFEPAGDVTRAVCNHARRSCKGGRVEIPGHLVPRRAGGRVVCALRQLGPRQRHRQRHERHDLLARRQDHAAGHGRDALSVYAALRCRTAAADGHALHGREQHLRLCSARCAGAAPCRCHQRHARRQLPAVRHCDP